MREVNVWINEKNYELPVAELTPLGFEELVDHRIFETLNDVQFTLLALGRASKYALEYGLACPIDVKNAIKHIESLARY